MELNRPVLAAVIVLLAGESVFMDAMFMLFLFVVSLVLIHVGLQTWRGVEIAAIGEHERTIGSWTAYLGSRRKYRTMLGAGHTGVLVGAGFAIISGSDLLRMIVGQGPRWGPWVVASVVGALVLGVAFVYLVAYQLFGVPDALRPPCQRGWREIHGQLVLVRPGTTPKEREERRPIGVDPAYRELVERRHANRHRRRRDDPWSG